MKEKIIEVLREHPGQRLRDIAMYLRCNRFTLIDDLRELYEVGIITEVTVNNLIQGDYYTKYYLAEDAPPTRAIFTTENLD